MGRSKLISAREEHLLLAIISLGDEATTTLIIERLALAYSHHIHYCAIGEDLRQMEQKGLLTVSAISTSANHDTVKSAYYQATTGAIHALAYREQEREQAARVRRVLSGGEEWSE